MSLKISRQAYAEMFGPTTGDRVRLADTELWIEVEKDFTVYGEEVKFGGGKVIRDGMGQGQRCAADVADTVITNALIVDHWGIVKADIGLKAGRISAIGKAGNPDIQPGVDIVIGAGTEIIAGEGMIVTAGGIDSHIHFICPQQAHVAIASGLTTMIGGGTGPAVGTCATSSRERSATACKPKACLIGKSPTGHGASLHLNTLLARSMLMKRKVGWTLGPRAQDRALRASCSTLSRYRCTFSRGFTF